MKREELKNRLDELPQNIDAESIWSGVELPEKKRKRPVAWWFVGSLVLLGLVVFGVGYQHIFSGAHTGFAVSTSTSSKHYATNETDRKTITTDQDHTQSQTAKSTAEEYSEKSSENLSNEAEENIDLSQQANTEVTYSEVISQDSNGIKNTLNQKANQNQSTFLKSNSNSKNTLYSNIENSNLGNSENPISITPIADLSPRSTEVAATKTAMYISAVPRLRSKLLFSSDRDILSLDYVLDVKSNFYSPSSSTNRGWMLSAAVGYGFDNHTFEKLSDVNDRNVQETALEQISASFTLIKEIERFKIGLSLAYYMSNTALATALTQEDWLRVEAVPSQRIITSYYEMYNTYHRVNAEFTLGYDIINNGSWTLVPYLGVGKGLFLNADGEYFDDEYLLRPLSADDSYGSGSAYWTAGLGTSVDLSDNVSLGLSGYLQSKQSLSDSHSVRPYGVRLSFGVAIY